MKALEARRLTIEELFGAPDGRERPASVALLVQEEPLEGVADVASGQRPSVVESDSRPEAEPVAQSVVLRGDFRDEPGNDDGAFGLAGQRVEDVREALRLFDRTVDGGVEGSKRARDGNLDDSSADAAGGGWSRGRCRVLPRSV